MELKIPINIDDLCLRLGVNRELFENTIGKMMSEEMEKSGLFRIRSINSLITSAVPSVRNYIYIQYNCQEEEKREEKDNLAIGQVRQETLASLAPVSPGASRRLPKEISLEKEVNFFGSFYTRLFPNKQSPVDSLVRDFSSVRERYSGEQIILAVSLYHGLLKYHWTAENPVTAKQFLSDRSKIGPVDFIAEALSLPKAASDKLRAEGLISVQGEVVEFTDTAMRDAAERIKIALSLLNEQDRKEVVSSWKIK